MSAATTPTPTIIDANSLALSRQDFPTHVTQIVTQLQEAGHQAYVVGGGVRDLLLDKKPKDFDIATSALPEEIKTVFGSRCRIIGRRFRLAHIRAGRNIIEVATFRGHHTQGASESGHNDSPQDTKSHPQDRHERRRNRNKEDHLPSGIQSSQGLVLRDNVYGTIEEDAIRRDFTMNALYYDPTKHEVRDYTHGIKDVESRTLRLIGDPQLRYREDPVRLIRAIRLSQKLDLEVAHGTLDDINELATLLHQVPAARLFDEMLKLFLSGHASASFNGIVRYNLLPILLPETAKAAAKRPEVLELIKLVMRNTDARLAEEKPVTPAFLFAAFLWYPVLDTHDLILEKKVPFFPALHRAMDETIAKQADVTAIPKRFSRPMQEIWELQFRLARRTKQRVIKSLQHPRFRAGYDLLLLREEAKEIETELGPWWTEFQFASKERQNEMIAALSGPKSKAGTKTSAKGKKHKTSQQKPSHAPKKHDSNNKSTTAPSANDLNQSQSGT